MREITSATNPFIKHLRALAAQRKVRQESSCFIIEGWRGIDTLLHHKSPHYSLETLVLSPEWIDDPRLPENLDTVLLPDLLFEKVSGVKSAQGILGIVRHAPAPLYVPESGKFLLLDNIRDPGNLGTLIRSAVGAGFDGILLYGDCVEPFNPKVVRSTMGTFAFTGLWPVSIGEIDRFMVAGYELCTTSGTGGENLFEAAFGKSTILAIGSEAHGISPPIQERASRRLTIPLQPECESLNAAVAGSICMFGIANTN